MKYSAKRLVKIQRAQVVSFKRAPTMTANKKPGTRPG